MLLSVRSTLVALRGVRTQEQVSRATGISQVDISRYERGRRTPPLAKLATLLDYYDASDAARLAVYRGLADEAAA